MENHPITTFLSTRSEVQNYAGRFGIHRPLHLKNLGDLISLLDSVDPDAAGFLRQSIAEQRAIIDETQKEISSLPRPRKPLKGRGSSRHYFYGSQWIKGIPSSHIDNLVERDSKGYFGSNMIVSDEVYFLLRQMDRKLNRIGKTVLEYRVPAVDPSTVENSPK